MEMSKNKKISQEFFDSIVSENLNDFGMSEEEAIEDAISQLKSQGADLSMICKHTQPEQKELLDSLANLNTIIQNPSQENLNANCEQVLKLLKTIKEKFDKDLSFRCLASRQKSDSTPNAYQTFISYFKSLTLASNEPILESFLDTFLSYINQQSDILDEFGLSLFIKFTNDESQEENASFGSRPNILKFLLKCLNAACLMNEPNRQFLVNNGLCENLMRVFLKYKVNDAIICDASKLIRGLLLDDDIRVEFGNAHEHAKIIASKLNGIDILMQVGLNEESTLEEETLASLMLSLSKLAVRNEFCQEISDKGGLRFVLKCIDEKFLKNTVLLKSALSLLKSICNNDQVKYEATKLNAIASLKNVLEKYNANATICELTCGCLAAMLLRNPQCSELLYQYEVHRFLVQLLNIHAGKSSLIKSCCLALRNSISRNKHFIEKLLELRVEETLRGIMKSDTQSQEEVKSLLRDLGCQIELKELWAGTGKNLAI